MTDRKQTLVEYARLCRQTPPVDLGFSRHAFAICDCRDLDLSDADLSLGDFEGGLFCLSNLSRTDLSGARLFRADLCRTSACCTRLSGANLAYASLRSANLTGADLSGANLAGAHMHRADLTDADLSGADLTAAFLDNIHLNDTKLAGAIVEEGVIDAYIAGETSTYNYRWFALRLTSGKIILQYGCDRAPLSEWQGRTPDYCATHGHRDYFWWEGPALAIAATERWASQGS